MSSFRYPTDWQAIYGELRSAVAMLPDPSVLTGVFALLVERDQRLEDFLDNVATGGGGALVPSGVTPGSYGDPTHVAAFTVDINGIITAAANAAIAFPTPDGTDTFASASPTTTYTADFTVARVHRLTLGGNTAITLAGATAGKACGLTFYIVQDATGGRIPTFSPTPKWPNGVAPTLSTAAAAVDVLVMESTDGGTSWYANLAGKAYA